MGMAAIAERVLATDGSRIDPNYPQSIVNIARYCGLVKACEEIR